MGDSDDEYSTKRNRDKFHRERDESNGNNNNNSSNNVTSTNRYDNNTRSTSSWKNRSSSSSSYNQGSYPNRDYSQHQQHQQQQQQQQRRYSPSPSGQTSPPFKRNRKDYDDYRSSGGGGGGGGDTSTSDNPTQPPCLTFKQFLAQQDDSISDEEAIKRYNEYKIDFKRTQISEFFLAHKEEEWFKARYHPDECFKRYDEHKASIVKRCEVFMDLYEKGWLKDLSLEVDKSDELIKFLDASVIKLEGGSDEDVRALLESTVPKESKIVKGDDRSESENGASSDDDESKREPMAVGTQLHKTTSIFLRNLPASITRAELETLFKDQVGFKRVTLSDPAPDRGFYRRGWVSFNADVDIRKICWNVNNSGKLKDSGAIVNRELTRRVRSAPSNVTSHKSCIKSDIKLATKIVENFDRRWNLWNNSAPKYDDSKEKEDLLNEQILNGPNHTPGDKTDTSTSKQQEGEKLAERLKRDKIHYKFTHDSNPLLENITDFLVDEMSAEEAELLSGENGEKMQDESTLDYQDDPKCRQKLDILLLYLRVVHSFDYYNYIEYQFEDTMPNRCGIVHARPSLSASTLGGIKQEHINDYIKQFEIHIRPYVEYKERLDDETAKKYGLKDKLTEVEKFIKTNTQKLTEDRWLCPLSGKKFKGAEFIRKHLFYKHSEKIEEVKKDVEYFNNYLLDLKRPQLPEHKSNVSANNSSAAGGLNQQQHLANQLPQQFGVMSHHHQHQHQPYQPPLLPSFMPPPQHSHTGYHQSRQNMWNQQYNNNNNLSQPRPQFFSNNNNRNNAPMINSAGGFQPNFNSNGPRRQAPFYGNNNNSNSRELINYRDLDAPEDF